MPKKTNCNNLSFDECELEILKNSIMLAETKIGENIVNSPEIKDIIKTVEDFIMKEDLICYGGISINAVLPEKDKIYNPNYDLSDYDFYSPNAMQDAKNLSNILYKKGYEQVEAKNSVHLGTYKVYCQFQGVADITQLPSDLFKTLKKQAVRVNGILHCPPNFLRMGMYLELSRPYGEIDRWTKVFHRLSLINKYYPLTSHQIAKKCNAVPFQREMEEKNQEKSKQIFEIVRDAFISRGDVFFGGYAINNYSQYMGFKEKQQVKMIADFDILCNDPDVSSQLVKTNLLEQGIKPVHIKKRPAIGEIIPEQLEISVGKDIVAVLYKPSACHSFNTIYIQGKQVKIATIDTMLAFYLAFLYANKPYYDTERILCMASFLFQVQQKNRLQQKGLLKRFTVTCYGHQTTLEEMKELKAEKYLELKDKKRGKEYEEWFFNYKPSHINENENITNISKTETIKNSDKKGKGKTKKTKTKTKKTKKTIKNRIFPF